MAKAEAAKEPGMEEILASIRQIISVDPADARAAPSNGDRTPSQLQSRPGADPEGVDAILDLMSGAARNVSDARADAFPSQASVSPQHVKGEPDMAAPSWLFPRSHSNNAVRSSPTEPSFGPLSKAADPEPSIDASRPVVTPLRTGDLGSFVPDRGEEPKAGTEASDARRLRIGVPLASRATDRKSPGIDAADFAAALAAPPPPTTPEAQSLDDIMAETLGPPPKAKEALSVKPMTVEPKTAEKAGQSPLSAFASLLRRSPSMQSAPEVSSQSVTGSDDAPVREPVPFPTALAGTARNASVAPKADVPNAAPAAGPADVPLGREPLSPTPASSVAETSAPANLETRAQAADRALSASGTAPAVTEAAGLSLDDILRNSPVAAADLTLPSAPAPMPAGAAPEPAGSGAAAAMPAPKATEAPPAAAQSAAPAVSVAPVVEVVADSASPAVAPAVAADKVSSQVPESVATSNASNFPAPAPSAGRTLEDAVSDLLRPMLRQWLDANMPRLVEKALSEEMSSRSADLKPKS
jgi:cell pole-organizing protein PopZ